MEGELAVGETYRRKENRIGVSALGRVGVGETYRRRLLKHKPNGAPCRGLRRHSQTLRYADTPHADTPIRLSLPPFVLRVFAL